MSKLLSTFKVPQTLMKRSMGTRDPRASFYWKLKKLVFEWSGYNRYGLYTDDVLNYEIPAVKEALRRLPKDVLDTRNFRIIRALQLDFLKTYLPKEKWITFEQDREYRYLLPYIQEVIAEKTEIYEFGCVNYSEHDWPSEDVK